MKKIAFGFTLFITVFLFVGFYNEAQAVTNIEFTNMQDKQLKNHDEIMAAQKEMMSTLRALQDTVNKMGNDLKDLKAANAENKAAMQKVQDASRESVNAQGQNQVKLEALINQNQEKTQKILEMIYQVLQKTAAGK